METVLMASLSICALAFGAWAIRGFVASARDIHYKRKYKNLEKIHAETNKRQYELEQRFGAFVYVVEEQYTNKKDFEDIKTETRAILNSKDRMFHNYKKWADKINIFL